MRFHSFANVSQRYRARLLAIFLILYLTYQQTEKKIQYHNVLHYRRISLLMYISLYIVLYVPFGNSIWTELTLSG